MIDLTTWNLTVPAIDSATLITTERLSNGYESQYFRRNSDGSISFWVPVNGSHASDSTYPRTELRETQADGRFSAGHFDLPMRGCTITLDGDVVVDQGRLVPGVDRHQGLS